MYKKSRIQLLRCITELHAGSGEAHSYIDNPIQREKHTGFPKIEGSSEKGALKEAFEKKSGLKNDVIYMLFGKDENADAKSALGFPDVRILFFPVRSMVGVSAYITCPRVLKKFEEEYNLCYPDVKISLVNLPLTISNKNIIIGKGECDILRDGKVMLEEFVFDFLNQEICIKQNKKDFEFKNWIADKLYDNIPEDEYWNFYFKSHFAVISDTMFTMFVKNHTSVVTRNRIDNITGTVSDTALFTVEYLPEESVLFAMVNASDEFSARAKKNTAIENITEYKEKMPKVVQIGGDATTGKGIVKIKVL